jgi:hypothetical protein
MQKEVFQRQGVGIIKVRDQYLHRVLCGKIEHDANTCRIPREKIKQNQEQKEEKGKALESTHFVIVPYNIGINKYFFKTSFASWRDAWLLDTGATYYMNFWRYFFEELNDNVEGALYFANRSNLKPMEFDIIRLIFIGFLYFLLHNVLYLELWRNLLSLVHIDNNAILFTYLMEKLK